MGFHKCVWFGKVGCYEINQAAYLLCWHDNGKTKCWEIITGKAECAKQATAHQLFASFSFFLCIYSFVISLFQQVQYFFKILDG